MNFSTQVQRGLVALVLCAAVGSYAAVEAAAPAAPAQVPLLGTITVIASQGAAKPDVIRSETHGKACVSVGDPVTLGANDAPPQLALR